MCSAQQFRKIKPSGLNIHDTMCIEGFVEFEQDTLSDRSPRATNQSINARNNLADYFVSDISSVSWQTNYI